MDQFISSYTVHNVEIDISNYNGSMHIQPVLVFIDSYHSTLIIKRIDTIDPSYGWDFPIEIFMHNFNGCSQTIIIDPSPQLNFCIKDNISLPNSIFYKSQTLVNDFFIPSYKPFTPFQHFSTYISRNDFNQLFNTDIVHLPSSMCAFGIINGGSFIYHESYGIQSWSYEISYTLDFIINYLFSKTENYNVRPFYCVLSATDGFIENCYDETDRNLLVRVGDIECRNTNIFSMTSYNDNEFPIFHKQKYILCQSSRINMPFCISAPDRYYLCLNRYNCYRSIHRGLVFQEKISKLVYAGNFHGSHFNFTKRRDIFICPRKYFSQLHFHNVCVGNFTRNDMIKYKYILDIDGNASTWDATAWKLNSGSVIFKSDSSWKQWFYHEFLPWKHFIPIKDDFSDIPEKLLWCENHIDECLQIISNSKKLFHTVYRHDYVCNYMDGVLNSFMNLYEH